MRPNVLRVIPITGHFAAWRAKFRRSDGRARPPRPGEVMPPRPIRVRIALAGGCSQFSGNGVQSARRSYTDTQLVLATVNSAPFHAPYRAYRRNPVTRAMMSSSPGLA